MTDREKVIEELENYEPYARAFSNLTVKGWIVMAVLELLRDQEAITDEFRILRCPRCNAVLKGKFCHECGQAVVRRK